MKAGKVEFIANLLTYFNRNASLISGIKEESYSVMYA